MEIADISEVAEVAQQPIFIVGVGRSGTSLLQSMLNAHPEITFLPETHFFRYYVAREHERRRHEKRGVTVFRDVLEQDAAFARAGIAPEVLLEPFLKGTQPFRLSDVYRRLLGLYLLRDGRGAVGDKDPRYLDYLNELQRELPQARILHIIRDPRDVILSRMKAEWSAHRPYWLNALVYRAQLRRGRAAGRRAFGSRYLEIHYEQLIEQPEAVMRQVCAHLELAYTDDMVRGFGRSAQALVTSEELQWKQNTLGELMRDNKEKWRKDLDLWQIAVVEALCSEPFEQLGYQRAGHTAHWPAGQKALLNMLPFLGRAFSLAYQVVVRFGLVENERDTALR